MAEAIAADIDVIQIRERDLEAGVLLALVARTVARARQARTRLLVNDRADVALAADADGVHLGAQGAPEHRLRVLREAWTIGRSIRSAPALRFC